MNGMSPWIEGKKEWNEICLASPAWLRHMRLLLPIVSKRSLLTIGISQDECSFHDASNF